MPDEVNLETQKAMNLMQLIKLVLDDAYTSIPAKNDDERDSLIKAEINGLQPPMLASPAPARHRLTTATP